MKQLRGSEGANRRTNNSTRVVFAMASVLLLAGMAEPNDWVLVHDSEYPDYAYYPNAGFAWYTRKTSTGCLFFSSESEEMHRSWDVLAEWEGDACTAGEYITGTGKLTVDYEDVPNRDSWFEYSTGTMEEGVFRGTIRFSSTAAYSQEEQTIRMYGGCREEHQLCQPRHRATR